MPLLPELPQLPQLSRPKYDQTNENTHELIVSFDIYPFSDMMAWPHWMGASDACLFAAESSLSVWQGRKIGFIAKNNTQTDDNSENRGVVLQRTDRPNQ